MAEGMHLTPNLLHLKSLYYIAALPHQAAWRRMNQSFACGIGRVSRALSALTGSAVITEERGKTGFCWARSRRCGAS